MLHTMKLFLNEFDKIYISFQRLEKKLTITTTFLIIQARVSSHELVVIYRYQIFYQLTSPPTRVSNIRVPAIQITIQNQGTYTSTISPT